jgi:hypothetical protein
MSLAILKKNFLKFCSISFIFLMRNFSFVSVAEFELLFKILIFVISNLNSNSKWLIFNIAVTSLKMFEFKSIHSYLLTLSSIINFFKEPNLVESQSGNSQKKNVSSLLVQHSSDLKKQFFLPFLSFQALHSRVGFCGLAH